MPWRAVFFRPGRSAAVARLLWEQDVAGSIPVAPTMFQRLHQFSGGAFGVIAFRQLRELATETSNHPLSGW